MALEIHARALQSREHLPLVCARSSRAGEHAVGKLHLDVFQIHQQGPQRCQPRPAARLAPQVQHGQARFGPEVPKAGVKHMAGELLEGLHRGVVQRHANAQAAVVHLHLRRRVALEHRPVAPAKPEVPFTRFHPGPAAKLDQHRKQAGAHRGPAKPGEEEAAPATFGRRCRVQAQLPATVGTHRLLHVRLLPAPPAAPGPSPALVSIPCQANVLPAFLTTAERFLAWA